MYCVREQVYRARVKSRVKEEGAPGVSISSSDDRVPPPRAFVMFALRCTSDLRIEKKWAKEIVSNVYFVESIWSSLVYFVIVWSKFA
jgi:hypothetical protein